MAGDTGSSAFLPRAPSPFVGGRAASPAGPKLFSSVGSLAPKSAPPSFDVPSPWLRPLSRASNVSNNTGGGLRCSSPVKQVPMPSQQVFPPQEQPQRLPLAPTLAAPTAPTAWESCEAGAAAPDHSQEAAGGANVGEKALAQAPEFVSKVASQIAATKRASREVEDVTRGGKAALPGQVTVHKSYLVPGSTPHKNCGGGGGGEDDDMDGVLPMPDYPSENSAVQGKVIVCPVTSEKMKLKEHIMHHQKQQQDKKKQAEQDGHSPARLSANPAAATSLAGRLSNKAHEIQSMDWGRFSKRAAAVGAQNQAIAEMATGTSGEEAAANGTQSVFVDSAMMKERVRKAIGKPVYNVANFYHETGFWQFMARHHMFDSVTLAVIGANALWIAIETDNNNQAVLVHADPIFQIMENIFCAYFVGEWLIRFLAFAKKRNCLRDMWFNFDSGLVLLMVLETWVMTLVIICTGGLENQGEEKGSQGSSGGMGNASVLRLVKLMRLTRMARMARLLRAMPELMILVKGMVVATRSVFFTLCLLVLIIYVFGIAFKQLTTGSEVGSQYFNTVPDAMAILLLHGCLGEDLPDVVNDVGRESLFLAAFFMIFVLLASLTVMNMLVGVLVEVVSVVSSVEKEQLVVNFVQTTIRDMLIGLNCDEDNDQLISKDEFHTLLQSPDAARSLQGVGVDVVGLVDFEDLIFQGSDEITFCDFMETVLQLRGSNTATVKDIVDLRKSLMQAVSQLDRQIQTVYEAFKLKLDLNDDWHPSKNQKRLKGSKLASRSHESYDTS
eukprot:TRINITY_DN14323_c0_g1_i1.p1 TRINITY_DN14323_c0_g1~~TRINITY_DN14323_c0_g1_i1.p1  ORF type:complete len:807 (-),score=167.33 TRINITY_DN14323_c0_g1_i1:99-2441(-)